MLRLELCRVRLTIKPTRILAAASGNFFDRTVIKEHCH